MNKKYLNKAVVDQFAQEIKVGDFVTYPCRQSSSMWMSVCKVLGVGWSESDSGYGYNRDPYPYITGEILTEKWNYVPDGDCFTEYNIPKKVTLTAGVYRCTIVPPMKRDPRWDTRGDQNDTS